MVNARSQQDVDRALAAFDAWPLLYHSFRNGPAFAAPPSGPTMDKAPEPPAVMQPAKFAMAAEAPAELEDPVEDLGATLAVEVEDQAPKVTTDTAPVAAHAIAASEPVAVVLTEDKAKSTPDTQPAPPPHPAHRPLLATTATQSTPDSPDWDKPARAEAPRPSKQSAPENPAPHASMFRRLSERYGPPVPLADAPDTSHRLRQAATAPAPPAASPLPGLRDLFRQS